MAAAAESIDVWHRRLGHIGLENVKKTAQITKGIEIRAKIQRIRRECDYAGAFLAEAGI